MGRRSPAKPVRRPIIARAGEKQLFVRVGRTVRREKRKGSNQKRTNPWKISNLLILKAPLHLRNVKEHSDLYSLGAREV